MKPDLLRRVIARARPTGAATPSRPVIAMAATIALGLGAVELWALSALNADAPMAGPVLGAALACGLGVLPALLNKAPSAWSRGAVAALSAVLELLFCLAVVGSVSAVAVLLLPSPLAVRLFDSDWTTDLLLLGMLGLGLALAARGWLKFSAQARMTARANIEAARARAQIAERDRELARSELSLLRAQIEPHFLWNTLAHVQHLTRKSPREAEAMTGHLIRFLRATVPNARDGENTLGAEMAAVGAYLELMKIRMGDRLTVQVDLEPGIAGAAFPPLLIQTLVENAIKHGIEPKVGPARVWVRAGLTAGDERRIVVEVCDDGVGLMAAPPTKGTGMGLRNVRERLRLLYGTEASLRIGGAPQGGVVARIDIPLGGAAAPQ